MRLGVWYLEDSKVNTDSYGLFGKVI
jgi:hypothetical protein